MDLAVVVMEYSAITAPLSAVKRTITPHRPVDTVLGGYFRQGVAYTNWRPRGSGDWLLLYTVAGGGLITSGSQRLQVGPGGAVLFRPGQPQDYRTDPAVGRWALRWAHFQPRPAWRAWLRWTDSPSGLAHVQIQATEIRTAVANALARLLSVARHDENGTANPSSANRQKRVAGASCSRPAAPPTATADLALNAVEEALLWLNLARADHPRWKIDARVRAAMDYLAAHMDEPFQLTRLAAHCGLSVSRLSHLFKEETGVTLQQYSEDLRLREARQLLTHTSLPMKEIAAAAGFNDPYYFSKRFKRSAGLAPTAWRARRDCFLRA